ncbi:lipopolysaccharide biosynthesis protein [Neobacillus vireti]|uniref:lipopolysaccharide biosynthesis protein n=1 Tax=Neobacillus vireti TaxID=220686 RepID=UPI002FFFE959
MQTKQNIRQSILSKTSKAAKWSLLAELAYRAITPVTLIVLARLLTPEDFGIVAIATILISFFQTISELGFNKIIIQKEGNKEQINKICDIAFWTNLLMSFILILLQIIFANKIAVLFKAPESALLLKVMSIQVLFYSLMSVQNSILQRELKFRLLFIVRIITVVFPALINIPLALMGFGYWALVFGSLVGSFANCIGLWLVSNWRPNLEFDLKLFKELLKLSLWNSSEALLGWIVGWMDIIIVAVYLTTQDLGLFRVAQNFTQTIFIVFINPLLPVLFSSLSRLQNNQLEFYRLFLIAQKTLCLIGFPIGILIIGFGDFLGKMFFGNQWGEIGLVIGILGLMNGFITIIRLNPEGYRAMSRTDINSKIMLINICIYIPTLVISAIYGFYIFLIVRGLVSFVQLPLHFYFAKKLFNISFVTTINNIKWVLSSSILLILFITIVRKYINIVNTNDLIMNILFILFSMVFYILVIILFERKNISLVIKSFRG